MFPCKVKIENLDPKASNAKNIDLKSNISLTKGQVKKIVNNPGERVPFYFIADYFEKNGKPEADFLAFGNSMKLEKHFIQNEMKKSKKSVVDQAKQDPKKAALGEVYAEERQGKSTLCFEPHDKSKIPEGKWPKILKNLKPYFAGIKAVVVLEGQITAQEENEENSNSVAETIDSVDASTTDIGEDNEVTVVSLASEYKDLLAEVKEAHAADHDLDVVKQLYKELIAWEKDFKTLSKEDQEKLDTYYKSFNANLDKVKKVIKADAAIDKKVLAMESDIRNYLKMENYSDSTAMELGEQIITQVDDIIKYCKFIKDNELLAECEALKVAISK